jgi:Ca-activated chloride channel family protein
MVLPFRLYNKRKEKPRRNERRTEMRDKKTSPRRRASLLTVAILATATVAASIAMKSPSAASHAIPLHFAAASTSPVSFSALLSQGAVLQGSNGQVRIKLLLGADDDKGLTNHVRVPTDVLVILDRSGSMEGSKMDYARSAVNELLTHLGSEDRFSLVTYSSGAQIAIPLGSATESAKVEWRRLTQRIGAGGGTNMSSGIDLALGTLRRRASGRAARMILLSDGLANEGDASYEGLTARALRAARQEYVLSAIGVGSDFNEYLMSGLADAGTGNYYYLENTRELANVFAREFEATRTTVASGVAVSIEPGEGVEVVEAAGYPLERDGRHVSFRPGSLFAGQEREIWVTLRVPSERLGQHDLGRFVVSYTNAGVQRSLALSGTPRVACVPDKDRVRASVDKKVWEASIVEEEYNKLQQKVARAVKEGRQEEAVNEIETYRERNTVLNREMGSVRVDENLLEVEKLERDVNDAFSGSDQQRKQNLLSKERQASAWDGRRAGSKR